jgi:hypothetical protein
MPHPATGSDHERHQTNAPSLEPLVVGPREACVLLGCGLTRFYEILPELESYLDGSTRRITVASIKARIARKLAEAPGAQRHGRIPPKPRKNEK